MALAKTVTHRYTGESVTFLQTSEETNGKLLLIEVSLPPQGDGPPLHVHDEFEEVFEVKSGTLTVFVGTEKHTLTAGDTIKAPKYTPHTFTNEHDEPVTFHVRLTPASQFEQSMRIHYGLMDDGLTDDKGTPKNILHLIYILKLQNTLIAGKSLGVQRFLFNVLLGIGKLTGSFKALTKYTK